MLVCIIFIYGIQWIEIKGQKAILFKTKADVLQIHVFNYDGLFSILSSFAFYKIKWLVTWKNRLLDANPIVPVIV